MRGSIPLAILGNKSDLDAIQKVETSKIIEEIKDQFDLAAIKYFTTSAKTGANVNEAFDWLIEQSIIAAGGDKLL